MDIITLSLAKKYANKVAAGFSNVEVQENNLIFTLNDGTKATIIIPIPDNGSDGVSVVDLSIDENGNLLCRMSNGSTINAGKVPTVELDTNNLISFDNTKPYDITTDYQPAHKKYVDDNKYLLPTASADILGGVKIGENLTIDEDGRLNALISAGGGEGIDLSRYATKNELPTKVSQLTNDSGFLTSISNGDVVKATEKGLYSWRHADMTTDYEYMAKLCDYLGLTEVYQLFRWNGLDSDVAKGISYLKNNTKNNVEVGYLCGEGDWYHTTDAKAHIDKVVAYNNDVDSNAKITKLILDVEPWSLGLETNIWLNDYVNMITTVHTYANDNDLIFGLVIPYWLDISEEINNETVYKTIIDNCDEVHVMNYNRNAYYSAIDNELAYCKLSNKPIYSVAETQAPNEEHGVPDHVTYYSVGLDKLHNDWQALKDKYNYSNLDFAYHDYEAMKILIPTIPSGYATKEELNNAISDLRTGNVSSDVINSIVVVDSLPAVEEEGVLYLVKGVN